MESVWTWAEEARLRDALRAAMNHAPGRVPITTWIRMGPHQEQGLYLDAIWPIIKGALHGEVTGAGDHRRAGDQAIDLVG